MRLPELGLLGRALLRARPDRRVHLERLAERLGDPGLVVAAAQAEVLHQLEALVRPKLSVEVDGLSPGDTSAFVLQLSHVGHHGLAGPRLARAGWPVWEVVLAPDALDHSLPSPSRLGQLSRRLVPPSEGVRRLAVGRYLGSAVRAASSGAVVVWPGDSAYGKKGIQSEFLGLPWFFPVGAARCAQLARCPLRIGHVLRERVGRHRLCLGPPTPVEDAAGVERATRAFIEDLERVVRARPELYLWRMATMLAFGDGQGWRGGSSRIREVAP